MKVSLVIPAYNEEKYIGECLQSVIRNAPDVFEIIVVNNGSTDTTKEVVSTFARVRLCNESKKGITYARQRGFLEATGDIIAYIDADTRMPHGWFETLTTQFTNNLHLACLSGPYVYYDQGTFQQFLVQIYWYLAIPIYRVVGFMVVGGNFAIRRKILEKMKGFDTTIAFYGEDTNIARRASEFGKVQFSIKFFIYTSARRLHGEGFLRVGYVYVVNFISEALFHKPYTTTYKDIR